MLKTLLLGALLVLPLTAYAQEATLSGTIVDSTNSVLPGVTVTAVHQPETGSLASPTDAACSGCPCASATTS